MTIFEQVCRDWLVRGEPLPIHLFWALVFDSLPEPIISVSNRVISGQVNGKYYEITESYITRTQDKDVRLAAQFLGFEVKDEEDTCSKP